MAQLNKNTTIGDKNVYDELVRQETQLAHEAKRVEASMISNIENVQPLFIPTFDGLHEPYHPSVKYFSDGWNGAKYWMAYTPYPYANVPPYKDRWECPSLAVSADGLHWKKPDGISNPLIDLTPQEITRKDFFSDPSIVMNGTTMEVWYRKTNGSNTAQTDIYRVTSVDGKTWTAPEMVINSQNVNSGISHIIRSHQVFFENGLYKIYWVADGSPRPIVYAQTTNPSSGVWNSQTICTLRDVPSRFNPWHIGMYMDENGQYHITAYDNSRSSVDYFVSTSGTVFQFVSTILTPQESIPRWYQSYPLKVNGKWLLYASLTKNERNGITLLKGDTLDNLSVIDTTKNNYEGYLFQGDVVLDSNTQSPSMYVVKKTDKGEKYGYGMKNSTNEPVWFEGGLQSQKNFMTYTIQDVKSYVPKRNGELIEDSGGQGFFLSRVKSGGAFRFVGLTNKINQTRSIETTVDIAKNEIITFNEPGANGNTTIDRIIGMEPYQIVTLINLTSSDITINDSNLENSIMTQTRTAYTLKSGAAVRLISSPYQTNQIRWHVL